MLEDCSWLITIYSVEPSLIVSLPQTDMNILCDLNLFPKEKAAKYKCCASMGSLRFRVRTDLSMVKVLIFDYSEHNPSKQILNSTIGQSSSVCNFDFTED